MSYFLCVCRNISPYERKTSLAKSEEEIFTPDFCLHDMSGTPVGSVVSRNLKGRVPYVITHCQESEALIDKGPKKERRSALFLERLKGACNDSHSVSLLLWWSRGYIFTEVVPVKRQCKITIGEFEKIFPKIEENALYVIQKEPDEHWNA